jgi:hypothetical protein
MLIKSSPSYLRAWTALATETDFQMERGADAALPFPALFDLLTQIQFAGSRVSL